MYALLVGFGVATPSPFFSNEANFANKENQMKLIGLCVVVLAPFLAWAGFRIYWGVQYNIHVEGYLKRAADANTVSLAQRELQKALEGIEERNWTSGSTHILWYSPASDVEFWYTNLKEAEAELSTINEESAPLERSNMLMKLRETILDDNSEGGVVVTAPAGISIYPHNKLYCLWAGLSLAWGGLIAYSTLREHLWRLL